MMECGHGRCVDGCQIYEQDGECFLYLVAASLTFA